MGKLNVDVQLFRKAVVKEIKGFKFNNDLCLFRKLVIGLVLVDWYLLVAGCYIGITLDRGWMITTLQLIYCELDNLCTMLYKHQNKARENC